MMSRRLLRVKTLKLLFSNAGSEDLSLTTAENDLLTSIQKTYDLYHFLMAAIIPIADHAEERINVGLQKYRPTYEEAHPNRKLIQNELLDIIRRNRALRQYNEKHCLSWGGENMNVILDIYARMTENEYYKDYMTSEERSFEEDRKFLKRFFMYEFEDNRLLENMLEEQSVWWVDDIGYALGSVLRSLDKFVPGQSPEEPLSEARRSREDEEFALRLLRHSLNHYFKYWNMAMQFVQNWEADRVAAMDMALIVQGFAEAIEFPEIPIKVTINEHVEIAKFYSTSNSHSFVNGVLDRMIQHGLSDGTIQKEGRGLVQDTVIRPR
ncbi:MAG: transcription antitermination protein NusB [Prevotellaceae bacterium]|jgi:N utilization substance protein B|nr:transcription antitermination protein NusB [Prevotellaceae bacterium]